MDRRICDKNGKWYRRQGKILGEFLGGTPPATYYYAYLSKNNKNHPKAVHRLVAEHFLEPPQSEDLEVCHRNGDRYNNCVSNLKWDTHLNNMLDRVDHGGDRHASATECLRGHSLSGYNLQEKKEKNPRTQRSHRRCSACNKATSILKFRPEWQFIGIDRLSDIYYEIISTGHTGYTPIKKILKAKNII